jgi:hypothetical protein
MKVLIIAAAPRYRSPSVRLGLPSLPQEPWLTLPLNIFDPSEPCMLAISASYIEELPHSKVMGYDHRFLEST